MDTQVGSLTPESIEALKASGKSPEQVQLQVDLALWEQKAMARTNEGNAQLFVDAAQTTIRLAKQHGLSAAEFLEIVGEMWPRILARG